jgi:hypothetical protein
VQAIASAYVYPLRRGRGSVDLAALHAGSGSVRVLSPQERAALQTLIDARRPVHLKSFRVLDVHVRPVDVEVTLEERPGAEHAWDWDDTAPLEVAAWEGATRTLTFTTDRPSDMAAGDRLVVKTALGSGAELAIEALHADSDKVVLARAPSAPPTPGDAVYSGGALVISVRAAILAHIDALGPAVGEHGTGEWDDALSPARILAEVLKLEGVRNGTVLAPAVKVTPADPPFPTDGWVELLVPRQVLVRRA